MICEFYSGSYAEVGEDGIVKFRLDTDAGTLKKVFAYQGVRNPSYIRLNADKSVLYAVQEETPAGAVHALRVDEDALRPMGTLSTGGADPCFIGLTADEKVLLAANYTSGSLAVYRLGADGSLTERSELIVHEGRGAHPTRQEAAHVHCAMERNGQAFVVDLGLDLVFIYDIDREAGRLAGSGLRVRFPAGAGPRHIAFHPEKPEMLYAVCELTNQIGVYREEGARYVLAQLEPTLPEDFRGENTAAAVKIKHSLLFASNRGHNSIAVYRIKEDGLLEPPRIVSSAGGSPRDFELFGDYMVVANQYSNTINVLKVDWNKGTLTDTGIFCSTPRPCCIQSAEAVESPSEKKGVSSIT